MWGSKCRGCEAKDTEIEHLLALLNQATAQNAKAQASLAELAGPGVNQRIGAAPRPVPVRPVTPPPQAVQFPGYAATRPQPDVEVEG